MTPEKQIENEILDWCALHDIKVWKIKSMGTFDQSKGSFRRPDKRYKRGVADILGIFEGKPLAIEVKSDSGRLSIHQKLFLEEWTHAGGFAIVARSVDDVRQALGLK